jgi:hypothetical protein
MTTTLLLHSSKQVEETTAADNSSEVAISVIDTGVGIPEQFRDKLFDTIGEKCTRIVYVRCAAFSRDRLCGRAPVLCDLAENTACK